MRTFMTVVAVVLAAWGLAGCGSKSPSSGTAAGKGSAQSHDDHDGHDHAGHDHDGHDHDGHGHEGHSHDVPGPHGGQLIVLGDEQYHAELVHDDETGKVTVYLLGANAKSEARTEAQEITIVTKVGEVETAYALPAEGILESEPPQASQFAIEDKALVVVLEALGATGTTAELKLTIKGQEFTAAIEKQQGHGSEH